MILCGTNDCRIRGTLGLHGCLLFMSGVCIFGMLFVIFVMEETNGTNLDSIGISRVEANTCDSNNAKTL